MTLTEFRPIADRINRLWKPDMSMAVIEEYHAVLEEFPAAAVNKAVDLIARAGPRQYRPDVGLLYDTAAAQVRAAREALPAPDVDPLSPEEHERVIAEERRRQSDEHRRRHEAVVDLLRSTGYRIPLAELYRMMPGRHCDAAEFDRRMVAHRAAAQRRSA